MPHPMLEVPFVDTAVGPEVLTIPIGHSIDVISHISVAVLEHLLAAPIFHPIAKLTLVKVRAQVLALPVRQSSHPVASVHLPRAKPIEASLSLFGPFLEPSHIGISVGLQLVPYPTRQAVVEDPFEDLTIVVD